LKWLNFPKEWKAALLVPLEMAVILERADPAIWVSGQGRMDIRIADFFLVLSLVSRVPNWQRSTKRLAG
jgi:hypothetical protein